MYMYDTPLCVDSNPHHMAIRHSSNCCIPVVDILTGMVQVDPGLCLDSNPLSVYIYTYIYNMYMHSQ